ncbi:hypothetical protein O6H91_13G060300 [Diphasiastrum complanatum]|uniref:Uncharacterized protein n=1 Tax=Diphasiastrum complanatum TaxID=34168 RepID=A0ACC2BV71_DIPCM|nr:hypothetical protein O6H91_13G060300 [Diphasiastrum complanatum]
MTSALDMSLDDVIKTNKQATGGRGGGRGGRRGGFRRGGGRGSYGSSRSLAPVGRGLKRSAFTQASPYTIAKSLRRTTDAAWQHDLFEDSVGAAAVRPVGIETGTKLYVSNLDFGVSNDDIKELFSEVGEVKRCGVNFDRSGRSKGTAEVVFSRRADALAAVKRYNNVQLDGKPMKIEIIGLNLMAGISAARASNGVTAGRGRTVVMTPGFTRAAAAASLVRRQGSSTRRGRGGFGARRFGRGRGRGRGRGFSNVPKTAEELDAELETYHADAMQIS